MKKAVDNSAGVRADKWLWAARFYKTRALAMQAINGGKVHVEGNRIKPARRLVTGDKLAIQKGPYTFNVTVEGLSLQRGSAEVAGTLYCESEESLQTRLQLQQERKLQGDTARHRERRPDKRARRQIRQFKQQ